jgi:replicative DNA helicase
MGNVIHLPPASVDSEQSVLGGLLLDNGALDRVGDVLTEADFYRAEHRLIFRAITRLINDGKPADTLTVADFLREHGKLDAAGGHVYLGQLVLNTPSAANIHRYAEIVRDKAMLRSIVAKAQETLEACTTPSGADPAEIAGRLEQALSDIINRQSDEVTPLGDAVAAAMQYVDALHAKGGGITGLATGFVDLDRLTGGFSGGDLVIIAGRPIMGKTSIALNVAEHVARHGRTVAVFSLEMSKQQLAMRALSDYSKVSMNRLRAGRVPDGEWPAIADAGNRLRDLPIFLDDTPGVACAHVRARLRRIKRRHGLALVVVDYLQLMRGDGDNRTQEIGSISRGLKGIAKELDVPVIALSQLSRRVEERQDKLPALSDLRDSGELEQDADVIMFVYRDEVYHPESPEKGTARILVRKQRNGPTGDIRLWFREELMRFANYAGPGIEAAPKPRAAKRPGFDYKTAQAGEL